MICHDCHAPDADCLAAVDGARLCETCLYERTLARLEEAQGEVRRLRARLADADRLADAAHQLFACEADQFDDAMRRVSVLLAMWFVTARGQA